ncbi:hypothetical protein SAMN04489730_0172 [Amycolatopsis australiensis]|uniref:Uncharacterized protein n=2 Tax=Amycolatopsis australiensis TaxID=546364 RepID=A0A1K1LRR7_9PSEU|nr:hypothetical protein SAMN04489730_0172 [Amycolatopsis australiensis]
MTQPNHPPTWPDQQPYRPLAYPDASPVPPPPKPVGRRIAIAVIGLLVAILAVTGFAYPGFFLHHHDPARTAAAPGSTSAPPTAPTSSAAAKTTIHMGSPEQLAEAKKLIAKFVDALNHDDAKAAGQLACPESASILGGQLIVAVEAPTNLAVADNEPEYEGAGFIGVRVGGTTNQHKVAGEILAWQPLTRAALCVRRLDLKW